MSQPAAKTEDAVSPMFTQSLAQADPAVDDALKGESSLFCAGSGISPRR